MATQLPPDHQWVDMHIDSPRSQGVKYLTYYWDILLFSESRRIAKYFVVIFAVSYVVSMVRYLRIEHPLSSPFASSAIGALLFTLFYLIWVFVYRFRTWKESIRFEKSSARILISSVEIPFDEMESLKRTKYFLEIFLQEEHSVFRSTKSIIVYCETELRAVELEKLLLESGKLKTSKII